MVTYALTPSTPEAGDRPISELTPAMASQGVPGEGSTDYICLLCLKEHFNMYMEIKG